MKRITCLFILTVLCLLITSCHISVDSKPNLKIDPTNDVILIDSPFIKNNDGGAIISFNKKDFDVDNADYVVNDVMEIPLKALSDHYTFYLKSYTIKNDKYKYSSSYFYDLRTLIAELKVGGDEILDEFKIVHRVEFDLDTKNYTCSTTSNVYEVNIRKPLDYNYIYVDIVLLSPYTFNTNVDFYVNGSKVTKGVSIIDDTHGEYKIADPNWTNIY